MKFTVFKVSPKHLLTQVHLGALCIKSVKDRHVRTGKDFSDESQFCSVPWF